MNRYMLMFGTNNYPSVFEDFSGLYKTIKEAKKEGTRLAELPDSYNPFAEVFDLEEKKVIWRYEDE